MNVLMKKSLNFKEGIEFGGEREKIKKDENFSGGNLKRSFIILWKEKVKVDCLRSKGR